jgi:hypothetical protein
VAAAALLPGLSTPAFADEMTVRIEATETALLRSPSPDAEVVRMVDGGMEFTAVTVVKDSYYLVKDDDSGSFYYVAGADLVVLDEAPEEKILISGRMAMPEKQDLSYWQVTPASIQTQTEFDVRADTEWRTSHNGKKYPAKYDYNADYRPVIDGEQLVRDAFEYLNTPYVLGGTSKKGIDCSGLTQVCLGKQGVKMVHRSSLQALEGRYVPHTELRAGDLIYFRDKKDKRYLSHVGIYVGRGKFIHAGQSKGKVVVTPLSEKYYKNHYAFARRL